MLKQLKKCLESEKKQKEIFDIIIYGSITKGKRNPSDLDVIVIFLEGTLRERLEKIQTIKEKIEKAITSSKIKSIKADIKQILLTDLFSSDFFARTGILLEGISVFREKPFSEVMGFKGFALFWYNLKELKHAKKVQFNYILAGRNKMKGIIAQLNGERLANGVIKIPINSSLEFEEVLKSNKINYKKKEMLEAV